MFLVFCGVPYDVAFALPPVERHAQAIMFQEFNGREFDIGRMKWIDRDK